MEAELVSQLKRVLTSLEQILPKPVEKIDWAECYAANWRKHSFSGYLELKTIPCSFWPDILPTTFFSGVRGEPVSHRSSARC
jgi:hypothetical protein